MMPASLEPTVEMVVTIKEIPGKGIALHIKAMADDEKATPCELKELSRMTMALAMGMRLVGTPAHFAEAETLMKSAGDLMDKANRMQGA